MDDPPRDEINKRLTLNWLIQGASEHAGMTLHYLIRDELNAINPKLMSMYDQFALVGTLQWWHMDGALLVGWPPRFWRRAATRSDHPFFNHPLLSRYGGMLAEECRQRALDRWREKRFARIPMGFMIQALALFARMKRIESAHQTELVELAKSATCKAWGIPIERLDAAITKQRFVAFGNLSTPQTFTGRVMRLAAVGYGGVMRGHDDALTVVARATSWPVVARELVKGTAELICLHGLNQLDDEQYQRVMRGADRIEYEPWMLQTGSELWRRVVALLPNDRPVSEMLMHIARLPAKSLERLMIEVMERPEWARELIVGLGKTDDDSE